MRPPIFALCSTAIALLVAAPAHAASGGPDAFGYRFGDSSELGGPIYEWVEISGSGDEMISGANTAAATINLAAAWRFYGERFERLRVSRNGFITTNLSDSGQDETNDTSLPQSPSNGGGSRIYVLHDNLELDPSQGNIFYEYFDESPHPHGMRGAHVITWEGVHHPGSGPRFSFQAILFDEGDILCQFAAGNPEGGLGSTTGIQNADASIGLGAYENTSVFDKSSIFFGLPRYIVTTTASSGAGSLRNALSSASGDENANVVFDPSIFKNLETIMVPTRLFAEPGTNVYGPSAALTLDGGGASGIVNVSGIEFETNPVFLENLTLANGSDANGGAISGVGALEMEECNIIDSTATNRGVIQIESTSLVFRGCVFERNTSGRNIIDHSMREDLNVPGLLEIRSCSFRGNSIDFGAIVNSVPRFQRTGGIVNIHNSEFTGNLGTAINLLRIGETNITNATIVGNMAVSALESGGINLTDVPAITIANSIVTGNEVIGAGSRTPNLRISQFATVRTGPYEVISNIIGKAGSSDGWRLDQRDAVVGSGNLDCDPLFVNPVTANLAPSVGGDFRLRPGSCARDAGDNLIDLDGSDPGTERAMDLARDLLGNLRLRGGVIDIGAYEASGAFQSLPPLVLAQPALDARRDFLESGIVDLSEIFGAGAGSFQFEGSDLPGSTVVVDPVTGMVDFQGATGFLGTGTLSFSAGNAFGRSYVGLDIRVFKVIHVRPGADPSSFSNGLTWSQPTNLRRAFILTDEDTQIWLQSGTYLASQGQGGSNSSSFNFSSGSSCAVLGGFSGNEVSASERIGTGVSTLQSGPNGTNVFIGSSADLIRFEDVDFEGRRVVMSADSTGTVLVRRCNFVLDEGNSSSISSLTVAGGDTVFEDCVFLGAQDRDYLNISVFGSALYSRCSFQGIESGNVVLVRGDQGGVEFEDCHFLGDLGDTLRRVVELEEPSSGVTAVVFTGCEFENFRTSSGAFLHGSRPLFLSRCRFTNNTSSSSPAVIFSDGGKLVVADCIFDGNSGVTSAGATLDGGGACYFSAADVQIRNSIFYDNSTARFGGAFLSNGSTVSLENTVFWDNSATGSNAISLLPDEFATTSQVAGSPSMKPVFSHCIVQGSGGSPGWNALAGENLGGNLDADPTFLDTSTGDFRVRRGSPLVNAGTETPASISDFAGNPRILGAEQDIGAFESLLLSESLDTDSDGLPDLVELESTPLPGSITALLPEADPDADGVPAIVEFYQGLDILVPDASTESLSFEPAANPAFVTVRIQSERLMVAPAFTTATVVRLDDLAPPAISLGNFTNETTTPHPTDPEKELVEWSFLQSATARKFFQLGYDPAD